MPELPEVETVTNAIAKGIGYSNIVRVVVNNNSFREKIPDDFGIRITGAKIVSYKRLAKYIIIGLNNGLSLIWHLGMSGKVKISDTLPEKLDKHDHVVIETDAGFLVFNDTRRFGLLTYCETNQLEKHHLLAKSGLDPFDPALNGSYLFEKLQKKIIPIKVALLDQHIINGIGNIYASEILYAARISPLRRADQITLGEATMLVEKTREVLAQAIKAGGSTIHDYKKPDGSLGYFQNMHCVYNKTGQKCPNCVCGDEPEQRIRRIVQAGRSTFYCPTLQK